MPKKSRPSDELKIYEDIRRRIKKRYDRRVEFLSHTIAFVIGMVILWFAVANAPFFEGDIWDSLAIIIAGGWFMGYLIHAVQVFAKEMEDRAVEREMTRLGFYGDYEYSDKQKREDMSPPERLLMLSDDGEMLELPYDEEEEYRR